MVLLGKGEGKRTLEKIGVNGRIIINWIVKKWNGACVSLISPRIGTGGGLL